MSAKILQFYNKPKEAPTSQEGRLTLVTASLLKSQERHTQNDGQRETRSVAVFESALATVDAAEKAILDAAAARIDLDRFELCMSCRALRDSLF